jgi:hypothetical protein
MTEAKLVKIPQNVLIMKISEILFPLSALYHALYQSIIHFHYFSSSHCVSHIDIFIHSTTSVNRHKNINSHQFFSFSFTLFFQHSIQYQQQPKKNSAHRYESRADVGRSSVMF